MRTTGRRGTLAADGSAFPEPSTIRTRVGKPFTAVVVVDGEEPRHVRVVVERVTVLDPAEAAEWQLDGTLVLMHYRATNLGADATAAYDPVSFRLAAWAGGRFGQPRGYDATSAVAPDDCSGLTEGLAWKAGESVAGCFAGVLPAGVRPSHLTFRSASGGEQDWLVGIGLR